MSTGLAILGIVGGVIAFLTTVLAVTRSVVKQVNATDSNSAALAALQRAVEDATAKIKDLDGTVAQLSLRLALQSERISTLEGAVRRNGSAN